MSAGNPNEILNNILILDHECPVVTNICGACHGPGGSVDIDDITKVALWCKTWLLLLSVGLSGRM